MSESLGSSENVSLATHRPSRGMMAYPMSHRVPLSRYGLRCGDPQHTTVQVALWLVYLNVQEKDEHLCPHWSPLASAAAPFPFPQLAVRTHPPIFRVISKSSSYLPTCTSSKFSSVFISPSPSLSRRSSSSKDFRNLNPRHGHFRWPGARCGRGNTPQVQQRQRAGKRARAAIARKEA
jgi:hypothetical protein